MSCWRCGLAPYEYGDGHTCLTMGLPDAYTVQHTTPATFDLTINSMVQGVCPKHGSQTSVLKIYMDIPEKGDWCQTCWCEEIARTCQRLLPPEP